MRALRLSMFVLLACVVSCSILIDTETAQCTSDGDCLRQFPSRGLVCLGSSCLPRAADPDTGTSVATCTNAKCMDDEAAKSGGPAICVAGKCQPLKLLRDGTAICVDEVLPIDGTQALRSEDVLVVGGFVPVKGGSVLADREALAYGLALSEIRSHGGLKIGKGGASRPVVMALCASEPDLVEDGLKHLTEDLKVPAIVARFDDDRAADLVGRYAVKNDVFTMNPYPAPYALKEAENLNGLAWHLLGGAEDVGRAFRPLMTMLEQYTLTKKTGPIKVALVTTDLALDDNIAEVIMHGAHARMDGGAFLRDPATAIQFNGQSTDANASNTPNPTFAFVRVLSQAKNPDLGAYTQSINDAVTALTNFRPDLIIAVTFNELGGLVENVDKALVAAGGLPALPRWVLSVGNSADPLVLEWVRQQHAAGSPDANTRFVGIQYAGSTMPAIRQAWLGRMDKVYAPQQIAQSVYSDRENAYDAIYWVAYGLFAGTPPGTSVNGTSLANGVRKLLSGPDIYPGEPVQLKEAEEKMREGNVRFVGALGPRDIDPRSGTIFGPGALYCYQAPPSSGQPVRIRYDVRRHDIAKGTLEPPDPTNPPEACFIDFPK